MAAATVLSLHPAPLSTVSHASLRPGVQIPLAERGDYARFLRALREERMLDLPLPGAGRTFERYERLRDFAAMDLFLGRLVEGHAGARSILADAGRDLDPKVITGVWAIDPPHTVLQATEVKGGWHLRGAKADCFGAGVLDRALMTAHSADGVRLFDIDLTREGIHVTPGSPMAIGVHASDSLGVEMDLVVTRDAVVGPPRFYFERPGIWRDSMDIAACWWGGAVGCREMLRERLARGGVDEQAAAAFGEMVAECAAIEAVLSGAAREIDLEGASERRAPEAPSRERALRVRSFVESAGQRALDILRCADARDPLVPAGAPSRHAQDFEVHLRQQHREHDLASLGRLALGRRAGVSPGRKRL